MNIFFLDKDPKQCAKMHCDKHVVKMIVEYAQLMSTALRLNGNTNDSIYKITHKNHPSAIWCRLSKENYAYLFNLFEELCKEYTNRYGKIHATSRLINELKEGINLIPNGIWSEPPQCVAEDCKQSSSVEAYREYYRKYKNHFATWKTNKPKWY